MRFSPQQLLILLFSMGIAAAGWMQGLQWKTLAAESSPDDSIELIALQQRVDLLTKENESLRSLAQGGGEFSIPPELIERVEKQLGLSYRSTPVIHRLAGEELRDRVAASLEARFGSGGLDDREIAYQLIGWLGAEDRLTAQLSALRSVGARAWFDEVSGEGWVTDRFQLENVPDQASLLRVLASILLQQHYPMAPGPLRDEAVRTRDALHSGVAAGVEAKFYQDNARSIGFMSLKEDNEASQLLLSLPPFIQGLSSFQSIEGKTFADSLLVKSKETLLETLRNPPRKTAAILYPYERDIPNKKNTFPETPGEVVMEDNAGALGLKLWLEPLGDVLMARNMGEQLCADLWRLFATDDSNHHLVWVMEFADAKSTDTVTAAFLSLGSAMAGTDNDLELGIAVKTSEGRVLRIDRISPTSIRLCNTANESTMTSIR